MIDFEKLKLAHDLSKEYSKQIDTPCFISIRYFKGDHDIQFHSLTEFVSRNSIDDLLEKLLGLNKNICKKCYQKAIDYMKENDLSPSITLKLANTFHDKH
ncbi:TPA: hypothetical protein ACPSKZ_000702 [Legionella anisa]|uniref:hypothetical protein n=1 Tax=Legionella anisa TaxID=28082 RepID=UPI0022449802|nr:hypothetical protein [Legionella anisa]MCW8425600.1 hypothetical protein [Legionella anisa]MCW8448970.1 hypothetical protein [Legionella anisa]